MFSFSHLNPFAVFLPKMSDESILQDVAKGIVANNLHKNLGGKAVVKDVSFTVASGELVGLMGPNGAGKTTTLRMLAGFYKPDAGAVYMDGISMLHNTTAGQGRLGYLPEISTPFGNLTVLEHLKFQAGSAGVEDIPAACATAMKLTRCANLQHQVLRELSKGQRQRIFLAGALLHDPAVLILDEPTDGLDPNQKHELRLVLKELAKYKAVLLSTHILEEAEAMCDRVLVMHQGEIVANETPMALAQHAKGDIQAAFRNLTT